MPLPVRVGVGSGVGLCALTQNAVIKIRIRTVTNREMLLVDDIDLENLSTGYVWTRRDAEGESYRRNSRGKKLRCESEDGVKNPSVTLLAFGAVIF